MKDTSPSNVESPSQKIDERIAQLADWRGQMLAQIRAIVKSADPGIVEEWKWMGTPVWEHNGIICTGETYKAVVKMTFHKGASLKDPSRLFNSSLEGNARRAIDFKEGEKINEKALKALVQEAIALNNSTSKSKSSAKADTARKAKAAKKPAAKTKAKTKLKAKTKPKAKSKKK